MVSEEDADDRENRQSLEDVGEGLMLVDIAVRAFRMFDSSHQVSENDQTTCYEETDDVSLPVQNVGADLLLALSKETSGQDEEECEDQNLEHQSNHDHHTTDVLDVRVGRDLHARSGNLYQKADDITDHEQLGEDLRAYWS